jgi:hypothetical protein
MSVDKNEASDIEDADRGPFPTLFSGRCDRRRRRQRNSHVLERKRGQCRPRDRSWQGCRRPYQERDLAGE